MIIDNTQFNFSLNDTTDLKQLILNNPDLPLLIFAGEESWQGEYCYNQVDARINGIQELTLYKDTWVDRRDYEDLLRDNLAYDEEYEDLSDEEFDKMIDKTIEETTFAKAIVVYVG